MAEHDDVPARLVAAAQRYDLAHRESGWQRVPDDQVRRLLTGARQLLLEIVTESMGCEVRAVWADDLRHVVRAAAIHLDPLTPPAEVREALDRLRTAAGEAGA